MTPVTLVSDVGTGAGPSETSPSAAAALAEGPIAGSSDEYQESAFSKIQNEMKSDNPIQFQFQFCSAGQKLKCNQGKWQEASQD